MSRGLRIVLIAIAVLLFLAISAILARYLQTENVERDDELVLLKAEAAGNVEGMLGGLAGCRASPTCVATVRANAIALRRAGDVKILKLDSATAYTLTGATGLTRVAWTVIGRNPVVQCALVRRSGNALTGISVTLLALSAPISNTGAC
jgi:hypothetical protein